jgi:hypothetical protein
MLCSFLIHLLGRYSLDNIHLFGASLTAIKRLRMSFHQSRNAQLSEKLPNNLGACLTIACIFDGSRSAEASIYHQKHEWKTEYKVFCYTVNIIFGRSQIILLRKWDISLSFLADFLNSSWLVPLNDSLPLTFLFFTMYCSESSYQSMLCLQYCCTSTDNSAAV